MKIERTRVRIGDLIADYRDNKDAGVSALDGALDIRPAYQREFVYKDAQRAAVIDTVLKGFPLNTIYWVKKDDGTFEVLDGQQRIISICQYALGDYSVNVGGNTLFAHNLSDEQRAQFEEYRLDVYVCEGSSDEKLEWFRTINIAGAVLTPQELRNATYTGPWLSDAKRYFSKKNGPVDNLAREYLAGSANRQEFLEAALWWASEEPKSRRDDGIKRYMATHQQAPNATALWEYFQDVIAWVKTTFPVHHKLMAGLDWGVFYNTYADTVTAKQSSRFPAEVVRLMADEEVSKKSGVYLYLLSGDERHLSLRLFDDDDKAAAYARQKGICPDCTDHFDPEDMEGDHIKPWSKGGKTQTDNCRMLCRPCNLRKSNR